MLQNNFELQIPLRQIIFNVTSILTGTGYTSTSYDEWGTPAIIVFLAITFIGGCAGSTTCGLKVFRLQVILKNSGQVMNKLISPNRVTNHKYNGENLTLEMYVMQLCHLKNLQEKDETNWQGIYTSRSFFKLL